MKNAAVVLVVGLLIGADDPDADTIKKEMAKFQGTWRFVSMQVEGMNYRDTHVSKLTLVLKGDQWTFSDGKKSAAKLTFELDPTKKPKTIDLVDMDPEKKRFIRGIYSLEGDTLTVCYQRDFEKGERPTEFATRPNSGLVLFVLKPETMRATIRRHPMRTTFDSPLARRCARLGSLGWFGFLGFLG